VGTALRDLLIRHVEAGTIPGGVALMGAGNVEVVTAGVAWVGGGAMGEDAIMRIQSMTKAITSVAALRLVEAGHLGLDQSLVDWLPELAAISGHMSSPISTCVSKVIRSVPQLTKTSVSSSIASGSGRRDRSAGDAGRDRL
jgi:CubicO group peptidase (beta-lactamase class C family)